MKLHLKIALATGVLALAVAPAALAGGPNYAPGPEYKPSPSPPPHAKAYGVYCKGESKKHVKGEKGTAFSRCVKALAKASHSDRVSARKACKSQSKKHVKGQQGTPFSRCVKAVAQLRKDLHDAQA